MADHWKSLADLLGAPGVDAPSNESEKTEPRESSPVTYSPRHDESVASRSAVPDTPPETAKVPAETANELELSFRSIEEPEVAPTSQDKEAILESSERPSAHKPGKEKKRSSWDTLTQMFKLRPVEEEPTPVTPPVSESQPELPLFKEPKGPANPALTEMFGDAPQGEPVGWSKPKRIVDDLGWGEDDVPEKEEPAAEVTSWKEPDEEVDSDESDEQSPKRRRRRRRGRRGRTRDVEPADMELAESALDEDWSEEDDSLSDKAEDVQAWDEPENFEAVDEEPEVVERRSSRRRKRGAQGRTRDTGERTTPPTRSPAPAPRTPAPRTPAPRTAAPARNVFSDDDVDMEAAEIAPSAAIESDDDEAPRSRRRRSGRGRSRRNSEGDETTKRIEAAATGPQDVDSDADDEDGMTMNKHRNIPTWADSIDSLVQANMENHRRNEGRGGPPRGRPRGRR